MKITGINIKSFKKLKSEQLQDVEGKNIYLIGGNEQGKTSFIEAVWFGLTGKNCPKKAIHEDGRNGLIEIDIKDDDGSEFTARTKLKKNRPFEFEVENKNFKEASKQFIKSPRKFIESKIGMIDFDIVEFLRKSNMQQIKYLGKYLNLDVSDIDAEIEEITESRKFDKNTLRIQEDKVNYYDKKDAAKEYVNIKDLMTERDSLSKKRSNMAKTKWGIRERKNKIKELMKEISKLDSEIVLGETWIDANEGSTPTRKEFKKAEKNVFSCETINSRIREAKEAQIIDLQVEKLRKAIQEADDEIENQRLLKAERISKAINIPNLTYDISEEQLLYKGFPFSTNQINTASQLIIGMKIAHAMLKDLKILKIDASLIDKDQFDKVLEWAEEKEVSLFVELVDRENSQLKIITDD